MTKLLGMLTRYGESLNHSPCSRFKKYLGVRIGSWKCGSTVHAQGSVKPHSQSHSHTSCSQRPGSSLSCNHSFPSHSTLPVRHFYSRLYLRFLFHSIFYTHTHFESHSHFYFHNLCLSHPSSCTPGSSPHLSAHQQSKVHNSC